MQQNAGSDSLPRSRRSLPADAPIAKPTAPASSNFDPSRAHQGAQVWLVADEEMGQRQPSLWEPAEFVRASGPGCVIVRRGGKEEEISVSRLCHGNPKALDAADNLTQLHEVNPPSIVHLLGRRYSQKQIYTGCGTILISVNPYQTIEDLYSRATLESYFNQPAEKMPPHVFAIAESAYRAMLFSSKSQSILVSGESGAGKTETTKFLLQFLAQVGKSDTNLEQKILQSTPILEAFGNAKTIWNDNSSRFGKFIKIEFSRSGNITGGSLQTYLLEKSYYLTHGAEAILICLRRIVRPPPQERGYHIFYRLLAGAPPSMRQALWLLPPKEFMYLRQSDCYVIPGVDDAAEYARTVQALTEVGVSETELQQVFAVLSAILHLSNVSFIGDDRARLANPDSVLPVCELLGCDAKELERALLTKEMRTGTEVLTVWMNTEKAQSSRDTLAMLLYGRLFDWLVGRINAGIRRQAEPAAFIGVLDIYGFESFATNSFEQLCINYANEKLQQFFNSHIFKLEQEEYAREKIDWTFVDFKDNQECIDLIEGNSPMGVFSILDEESRFPKATDETFLAKLIATHKKHINFKLPEVNEPAFLVSHFAGRVKYSVKSFLEKNRDYLVTEHVNLLSRSTPFVASLSALQAPLPVARQSTEGGRARSQSNAQASSFAFQSVASQFRDSLATLIDTMARTQPHYIRCIKPNDGKLPQDFTARRVLQQLRSGGVFEAVRVAAAGFPSRLPTTEFMNRYKILFSKNASPASLEACTAKFAEIGLAPTEYRFGQSKLFLRTGVLATFESLRMRKLHSCATPIESRFRMRRARAAYQQMRVATQTLQAVVRCCLAVQEARRRREHRGSIVLQKHWRGRQARFRLARMRVLARVIQSAWRSRVAALLLKRMQRERLALVVQTQWRMHLCHRRFALLRHAALLAQAVVRQHFACVTLERLKAEARSLAEAAKQREQLQQALNDTRQALEEERRKRGEVEEEVARARAALVQLEAERLAERAKPVEPREVDGAAASGSLADAASALAAQRLSDMAQQHKEETEAWEMEKARLMFALADVSQRLDQKESETEAVAEGFSVMIGELQQRIEILEQENRDLRRFAPPVESPRGPLLRSGHATPAATSPAPAPVRPTGQAAARPAALSPAAAPPPAASASAPVSAPGSARVSPSSSQQDLLSHLHAVSRSVPATPASTTPPTPTSRGWRLWGQKPS